MRWNLHFVSHTHWDREWYEAFDAFRLRLVNLIDHLLDILQKGPLYQSFLLDGQSIIIEDYLEIKPERELLLKNMIRSGRIFVGPWYVLPDEFLISGETHVRNLLFGEKICRTFGGKMNIGYLPDSFGHIAQMPQILKKSGISYAVIWRGVPKKVKTSEFYWESPDGSKVLTLYMPLGYGVAANLPSEKEELVQRVKRLVENLSPFATTSHILLMNGSDHVEPESELSAKLSLLKEALPEHIILHSNLPYIFDRISEEIQDIPSYKGEWRADDFNYLLGGTLSSRVYLKQKHGFLSHTMEGQIEPLCSTLSIFDYSYPIEMINYLWKLLLQNSPHDSICGCSIDAVHEEMMQRYRKMETIIYKLLNEASKKLEYLFNPAREENLIIFNPHPYPITSYIECDVMLQKAKIKEVDFEAGKLVSHEEKISRRDFFPALKLVSGDEEIYPETLQREHINLLETPAHTLPEVFSAQCYRIAFTAHNLPPIGFKTYRVVPLQERVTVTPHQISDFVLENEFYKLQISPSGELLTLEDKTSKKSLPIRLLFEDGADGGDEYDYSSIEKDEIISSLDFSPTVSWLYNNSYLQRVKISYELKVPYSITPERKERSKKRVVLPIEVEISLSQGVKRIDLDIRVNNTALDHRFRVIFEFPIKASSSLADAHFAVLERKIDSEKTFPQNDFVLVQDGASALAILNQGLREYQTTSTEKGTIVAITLLRCIGWLSRSDLLTRKGDAGWSIPAPGAQSLGKHVFNLALIFDEKQFPQLEVSKEALLFARPPLTFQIQGEPHILPIDWTFLSFDNPCIVLSALKKREDREEIVLRFYNPTPQKQRCEVDFKIPIYLLKELSLLEKEIQVFPLREKKVVAEFNPYEIKTWGLVFKENKATDLPLRE